MKALVTGVAGFIGSSIAEKLVTDGFDVVGIDSLTDYYSQDVKRTNLVRIEGDINLVEDDINSADLDSLLSGVDYIFHQAGQPGVRSSWGKEFELYTERNINATQRLLEASKRSRTLKKFVYASSSSVYGDAKSYPTSERDLPQPRSPYGVTKLAAEHLCSLYADNFGVPTVSLRYFTVYGPRQRPDMAFQRFITAALNKSTISIYGDGYQVRDFTFIDDIVQANILAAKAECKPGTVVNISGGSNVSVRDVLSILEKLADDDLRVEYSDAVPGDVRRTGGDASAAESLLGWTPKVTIESGLEQHFEFLQSKLDIRGEK